MRPAKGAYWAALLVALFAHVIYSILFFIPPSLPDAPLPLPGVSLTPHTRDSGPGGNTIPPSRIEAAVAATSHIARRIRTYSTLEGQDLVAEYALRHGLSVALGIWVDKNRERTRAEIERAVSIALSYPNVDILVVGNETMLDGKISPSDLIDLLREVRSRTGKLITTTEPWDVWLRMPELAQEVDILGVHILPYWFGVSPENAARWAIERYYEIQSAFPGKRIWVAEYGWPSGRHGARATPSGQARALREFALLAQQNNIEWNLVEAIDQPWKTHEGQVGPYWGVMDVDLRPKYSLSGPVWPDSREFSKLILGPILGLVSGYFLLLLARPLRWEASLFMAIWGQFAGWLLAGILTLPLVPYLPLGESLAWALGLPMMVLLFAISLERTREAVMPHGVAEKTNCPWQSDQFPVVSIHIAARQEKPEVLRATLESVAALDWPKDRLEVIVVLNNMPNGPDVLAAQNDAARLGNFIRVIYVERLSGYKAGALNLALRETRHDAEIIGVIDADYTVDPQWLRRRVPDFADDRVAISQAPQAHRDGERSLVAAAMSVEADGFFDSGMIHRQRDQAIVVHGTMLLLRRKALLECGGWNENHICEDTELGLRLQAAGWHSVYTPERLGYGLLPDDLSGFGRQRWRWACGGMFILRCHYKLIFGSISSLSLRQRWHTFSSGLYWMGEVMALGAALFSGLWGVWIACGLPGSPPDPSISALLLWASLASWAQAISIHGKLGGIRRIILAGAAAAAAQISAAHGAVSGLMGRKHPFKVTPKGGRRNIRKLNFPEAGLAILLIAAAGGLYPHLWADQTDHILFFVALIAQAAGPVLATLLRVAEYWNIPASYFFSPDSFAIYRKTAALEKGGV